MTKTGGLSNLKEKDDIVKELILSINDSLINKLILSKEDIISIHSYKTQIVAGIIFFLKITINNKCYHIKIINYLPHTNKSPELLSIQTDKNINDEISFF